MTNAALIHHAYEVSPDKLPRSKSHYTSAQSLTISRPTSPLRARLNCIASTAGHYRLVEMDRISGSERVRDVGKSQACIVASQQHARVVP